MDNMEKVEMWNDIEKLVLYVIMLSHVSYWSETNQVSSLRYHIISC
jgi:hypothetical protein